MIVETTAARLAPGDILSTDGSRINLVVPSHHGTTTYIDRTYDDGFVKCETVPSDTRCFVWRADEGEEN